jgi:hypothetical protein
MLRPVAIALILFASALPAPAAATPEVRSAASDRTLSLARAPQHPERTLTVPAETEAAIQLLSGIHSRVSHVGDPVMAEVLNPIYVDGQIALPAGTLIDGRITRIRPAGRMRRPAEMALRFEHVTLPDGQNQPLSALLAALDAPARARTRLDSEGILKGTRTLPWKHFAGGMAGLGVLGAIEVPLASAAIVGVTLPLGGGAVVGYSLLFPKGNDVHVPPDTPMRIRLRKSLTVRVAW